MNFKEIAGTSFKEPINMKSLLARTTYFHDRYRWKFIKRICLMYETLFHTIKKLLQ